MTGAAVAKALLAQVEEIPLEQLVAASFNPRKTFDEAALKELAASIRSIGITNPLIVRPTMPLEGAGELHFEIIAGHRRAEAATLAGRTSVPCIVRELRDEEARELALIDNLQRVDVPPMEAAEAFGELLQRMTGIPAVSLCVGKDLAYVSKRLKLLSLGVWQRDALRGKLITIDHALLLARLGVEEQNQALKWCLDPQAGIKTTVDKVIAERTERLKKATERDEEGEPYFWSGRKWEPESPQRLKEYIERCSGRRLSRAPWSLEDAALVPSAGACSACPSNTKANAALFSDLDIDEATCAVGGCFEIKRAAFVEIALKSEKKPPLRLSWKATSTEPRFELGEPCDGPSMLNNFTRVVKRTQILNDGQWREAKKGSCLHVETGVTVDWSDANDRGFMGSDKKLRKPGEILSICAAPKCKAHPKAYEQAASSQGNRHDPAAEKAKEEKRKAAALEENKLRMALAAKALEGVTAIPAALLRDLGVREAPNYGDSEKIANALVPGLVKVLRTAAMASADFAKAFACASLDELACNEWNPTGRDRFLLSVRRIGYKGATPWDKPKAKPKPAKKAAKKAAVKKAVKR